MRWNGLHARAPGRGTIAVIVLLLCAAAALGLAPALFARRRRSAGGPAGPPEAPPEPRAEPEPVLAAPIAPPTVVAKPRARREKLRLTGRVLDHASSAALVLVLCGVIAVLIAPQALNWRYGILRSGSMSPKMPAGAAIVVAPADAGSIRAGDVITYRSATNRGLLITHRVFEVTEDDESDLAFRTKGDANKDPDAALVTPDRLVGRVVLSVPYVGQVAQRLHTKTGFFALMVAPTAMIIAIELRELGGGIADLRRQRRKTRAGERLGSAA